MKSDRSIKAVWDSWNIEHIKKHAVSVREVEEILGRKGIIRSSYKGRLIILGKTERGRILTIVISYDEKENTGYVVSARDSSRKERKIYDKNKTR